MYFIVCEGRKAGTQGNKNEKISYFVSNTSLSTYTHPSFRGSSVTRGGAHDKRPKGEGNGGRDE